MAEVQTLQKKYGKKIPWVMGKNVRIPRVKYPEYREGQMALPSPGRSLILIGVFIFLFYLVVGGIYISIRDPSAMGSDAQGSVLWLYPSTHDAFIIESIVAGIIIYLTGAGFFLIYNSTRHAFNYTYAVKVLVIGLFLAAFGFVLLQYMMDVKTP
jgi:hypothetical protein